MAQDFLPLVDHFTQAPIHREAVEQMLQGIFHAATPHQVPLLVVAAPVTEDTHREEVMLHQTDHLSMEDQEATDEAAVGDITEEEVATQRDHLEKMLLKMTRGQTVMIHTQQMFQVYILMITLMMKRMKAHQTIQTMVESKNTGEDLEGDKGIEEADGPDTTRYSAKLL